MRVAIVSIADSGHALTSIGVGTGLAARGHAVTVVTGAEHRAAAAAGGIDLRPLPHARRSGSVGGDVDPADRLQPLTALLQACAADVIVVDVLTRVGALAADRLTVPWIELVPHYLPQPSQHLPPLGLGWHPGGPWWRRWASARIRRLQRDSFAEGDAATRRLRARLRLPLVSEPAGRLVATLPALEYPRPDWPDRTYLVGAVAADPVLPPAPLPDGDEPLVVVTDSTVDGVDRSLVAQALRDLRDLPIRLAGTTSRKLAAWPAACWVGAAPHGPLLDHAAVAVGFGGHGFVAKALVRGVPVVVAPLQGDQPETAGRITWAGAGRRVPLWAGGPVLRWAVLRVLRDPAYRRGAEAVAASGRGLGQEYAAACVERIAAAVA